MSWPFETSDPFITSQHMMDRQRQRRGVTPQEWALPATLVLTFQRDAYARLLERASLALPALEGAIPAGGSATVPSSAR